MLPVRLQATATKDRQTDRVGGWVSGGVGGCKMANQEEMWINQSERSNEAGSQTA